MVSYRKYGEYIDRNLALISLVAAIVVPMLLVGIRWSWNTQLIEVHNSGFFLLILLMSLLFPFWAAFWLVRVKDAEYREELGSLLDMVDNSEEKSLNERLEVRAG